MIVFDFLIIFATCLALALFSLENTQEVALKILPQFEIQVHLAVAIIVAMGTGATLAGLYLTWIKVRNHLQFKRQERQLKEQEQQIQKLKEDMESRQAELIKLRQDKLSSESVPENENLVDEQYESEGKSEEQNAAMPAEAN